MDLFILLLVGVCAGTLAGLLGIGGGAVIVPFLVHVFAHQGLVADVAMPLAIGTSLATMAVTAVFSFGAHHRRGAVDWTVFRRMAPGVLAGGVIGPLIATVLPGRTLYTLFACFLLVVSVEMFFGGRTRPHRHLPGPAAVTGVGVAIGTVASLVGISGGSMTVPFLTWCSVPVRTAVGTAAAVGFPIVVAGALTFIATGWLHAGLPAWSLGFVSLPAFGGIVLGGVLFAPLGARLAHAVSERALRRAFGVFLVVVGVKMLLQSDI